MAGLRLSRTMFREGTMNNMNVRFQVRLFSFLLITALLIQPGYATSVLAISQANPTNATFSSCADVTEIPQEECEALVALYTSTNGTNWTNNTNWLQSDTPCSWYGISCENGTNVTNISLSYNKLSGNIPVEIENLSNLQSLNLSYNQLIGNIPTEIGNILSLRSLHLGNNQLNGSIPVNFENLVDLQSLLLYVNQLNGNIPAEIGYLLKLKSVNLGNNQLSGDIPVEIGNLANLESLLLYGNQLSGNIPFEIGGLSNLQSLSLSQNQLSGNIPISIGNLSNLQELSLGVNQLSGNIPVEIGNLANLQSLLLDGNQLSGNIPPEIGRLTNLYDLWLVSNQLSGSIPPELGKLVNLRTLLLENNQLSGNIPPEIGGLSNLSDLWLRSNQISGNIPPEIGSLVNLQQLLLSNNQLSGNIPPEIGGLINLRRMDINNNQLVGEFPTTITNLINLTILYFDCWIITSDPNVIAFLDQVVPGWENNSCSAGTSSISGLVTERATGNPVSGVDVCRWDYDTGENFACTSTDLNGFYTLVGSPSGDYRIRAHKSGWSWLFYSGTTQWDEATRISVMDGQELSGINFSMDPGGNISGYVRDSNGLPLSNILVEILRTNGTGWPACTDSTGYYGFDNVPYDVAWRVEASGSSYNQCGGTDDFGNQYWNHTTDWDNATTLTVNTQTPSYANINFDLEKGGSISGNVYEMDGITPIANAGVYVRLKDENDTVAEAYTDGQGHYVIEGLSPHSDYKIDVWAHGYLRAYYSDVSRWSTATKISVLAEQDTSGIDFHLIKADSYITGRVTYEDGSPAVNVWMEAFHEDGWFVGISANENGEYLIPVIAGTWRIFPYQPPLVATAQNVAVNTGATVNGINFTLSQGGSISGTVRDASNIPIQNAQICANDYDLGSNGNCTQSDANGNYTIGSLPTDDYRVDIRADGWAREYYNDIRNWSSATRVPVVAGSTTSNINFVLEPGGSILGYVYQSDGVTPISNMVVSLDGPGFGDGTCTDQNGAYTLKNVAYGVEWRVRAAPSGDNWCGGSNSYVSEYWEEVKNWDNATVLMLNDITPSYSGIDFTLDLGGGISGYVYQSDGGTPIVGARVHAMDTDFQYVSEGYTASDGSYQINGLPSSGYYLAVQAPGYGGVYYDNGYDDPSAILVTVTAPSNTPSINFQLSPEASISGHVYQSDGITPLPGAEVRIWPKNGGQIRSASTNPDGSYTVNGLSTGIYIAQIQATGYVAKYYSNSYNWGTATPIAVEQPNNTPNINFTMELGGSISGKVQDSKGNPISNARVCGNVVDISARYCTNSDHDGNYLLDGLASGNAIIYALATGWAYKYYDDTYSWELAQRVPIVPGVTIPDINFVLARAGSIQGTVYQVDNVTPIANMAVSLHGPDVELWACSDSYGKFSFYGVPQEVQFRVSAVESWRCPEEPEGYIHEYWQDVHSWDDATVIILNENLPSYNSVVFTLDLGETTSGVIGTSGGSVSTEGGSVSINVPPASVTGDITFTITAGGGDYQVATDNGDLNVFMSTTIGPEGINFANPATLTFQWSDTNDDGLVDNTNLSESHIVLIKDGLIITPICSANPSCSMTTNTLTVQVSSLSLFELAVASDTTPPVITWDSEINNGDSFYFGFVPPSPTCTAVDDISGVAGSCIVSGYATTIGVHTLIATAKDNAGNQAIKSINYTILGWTLKGFYQPVDMNGIYNLVKNGSTVPFKFEIYAGPTELGDIAFIKSLTYTQTICSSDVITDNIELTVTGGTSLRYDFTAGQFIYNWKTPNTPGKCYRVTLITLDGSSMVAYFKLK